MECRLVNDRSDQHGRAIVLTLYGQAAKSVRPAVVEVAFHSETIDVDHCETPKLPDSAIVIGTIYRRWTPVESAEGCSRGCNYGV